MAGRHEKRGRGHKVETPDLELMPMLNVFISIIPMLLLSAAFVQLSVIDTGLPAPAAAAVAEAAPDAVAPVRIALHADRIVIESAPFGRREIARQTGTDFRDDPARGQVEALLRAIAGRLEKKPEVQIVPEVRSRYDEIVELMDLARAAGLPNAALADAAPGAV
jgi:biopolymer transport protein ExbD